MNAKQMAKMLHQASLWAERESEVLDDFHAYAHMFGGEPGSNVFLFVLEDALRHRNGLTLEEFRAKWKERAGRTAG